MKLGSGWAGPVWAQGLLRHLPLIPTPPNNRPFSSAIGKGETLPGPQPVSRLHFPDQMEKTDSAVSAHPAPATLVLLCVFQTSAVLAEAGPSPPACSLSTQAHLLPLKAREAEQWGREEEVRPGLQETLDPHVSKKGHSSGPPYEWEASQGESGPTAGVPLRKHLQKEQDCNNADTGWNCRARKIATQES